MSLTSYRAAPPRGNGKRGTLPAPQLLCSSGLCYLEGQARKVFSRSSHNLRGRAQAASIVAKFGPKSLLHLQKSTRFALPNMPTFVYGYRPPECQSDRLFTRGARSRTASVVLAAGGSGSVRVSHV